MTGVKSRFAMAMLAAALAAAASGTALAQERVPTREGNTWDWRHHEPVPSDVMHKEQATGIAPSAPQQERSNDDVERLYRNLMRSEGVSTK